MCAKKSCDKNSITLVVRLFKTFMRTQSYPEFVSQEVDIIDNSC